MTEQARLRQTRGTGSCEASLQLLPSDPALAPFSPPALAGASPPKGPETQEDSLQYRSRALLASLQPRARGAPLAIADQWQPPKEVPPPPPTETLPAGTPSIADSKVEQVGAAGSLAPTSVPPAPESPEPKQASASDSASGSAAGTASGSSASTGAMPTLTGFEKKMQACTTSWIHGHCLHSHRPPSPT